MATTLRTNCVDIYVEGNRFGQDCFATTEIVKQIPNPISLAK